MKKKCWLDFLNLEQGSSYRVIAGRTAGLESAIRIALAGQLMELNRVNELTAYIA